MSPLAKAAFDAGLIVFGALAMAIALSIGPMLERSEHDRWRLAVLAKCQLVHGDRAELIEISGGHLACRRAGAST